jgi:hypothetical protein
MAGAPDISVKRCASALRAGDKQRGAISFQILADVYSPDQGNYGEDEK